MATRLGGLHHVALVTEDLDRLTGFYRDVFDADIGFVMEEDGVRRAMIDLGSGAALHPFEIADNPNGRGLPGPFVRGHIDHLALNVPDPDTFEALRDRLVEAGVSDGTVTDFGSVRSVSFQDPDGADCEIAIWCHGVHPRRFEDRTVEIHRTAI
ncbi:MAG: VOC family protein [Actinomycetota bacterium]|jgi:catechol 2,3-dioxygenase-like lactoylglutathione lyase family enzyme|nr:VOC family protein [Actinomycetota bacterium]